MILYSLCDILSNAPQYVASSLIQNLTEDYLWGISWIDQVRTKVSQSSRVLK